MNQREIALNILNKTIKEESYSNLLMRRQLDKLEPIQRAFTTNLVNGVLRNYETLSFQFSSFCDPKTSLKLRIILCMAMYERFYLHEKDYAVNHEYVDLCRNRYERSFVNAVLRKTTKYREPDTDSIRCNLPEWICGLLRSQYENDEFNRICDTFRSIPTVYYRINRRKCSFDDLKDLDITPVTDEVFTCKTNLLHSRQMEEGLIYVQDLNSASLYRHLDLEKDSILLDVCSAPGSKLFNCLDVIEPDQAYANDIHEKRVELIRKKAEQLGMEGVHYLNCDGRKLKDALDTRFDRIMLDAPCSGLGVIGRKPDLKFHIKPEDLDELQDLQHELLLSMDPLLKKDGILLYSTCTLNRKENSRQISRFLSEKENFVLLEEETIINGKGDCFYYAKMKKVD
ncbi:MAG: hypothetical protein II529_03900 [Erysipelotrichaceae bacterium]|nr:hypothetical protein [Erysipelotrichaceae bacterium]MBQ2583293.1 hypothetical protein [Erysipelotrichaceae bacterium]